MAKLYKTNGEVVDVEPKNGSDFQYDELHSLIGGLIEIVWLNNEDLMVVDEEGKLKDLPFNEKATEIYGSIFGESTDFIIGDALICKNNQIK